MARKKTDAPAPEGAPEAVEQPQTHQQWTHEQLKAVKHLGPGIIGAEMHRAAQAFDTETKGGVFGPALLATE